MASMEDQPVDFGVLLFTKTRRHLLPVCRSIAYFNLRTCTERANIVSGNFRKRFGLSLQLFHSVVEGRAHREFNATISRRVCCDDMNMKKVQMSGNWDRCSERCPQNNSVTLT